MIIYFLEIICSPIIDLIIFYNLSKQRVIPKDILIFLSVILISFVSAFASIPNGILNNIFEIATVIGYFSFTRKNLNKKIILGSVLIFGLFDFIVSIFASINYYLLSLNDILYFTTLLLINLVMCMVIISFSKKIRMLLTDENSTLFNSLLLYIYLSTAIVYFFILKEKRMAVVFEVSLALLILQIIFAIFAYTAVVHIQKNILTKHEQQRQKLELKLTEAQNKELILKQKQLKTEMSQLQEYTSYLDKNEDELRRFKHDYQNILTSLKVSAKEGNTEAVIDQLDQYTKTQFDQKALRKYKGINHIHEKNLKSIAIAKLTKLYSLNINYSFGCEKDINHIPQGIDIFDLVRIIGIAFDNAIEESLALIKATQNPNMAQVDAMYYQENGNFEFEIRNRVRKENIDSTVISQKNYTTKKHHMGLGLANVKEIAHKYNDNLLINYDVQDGWFDFDLLILPSESEEQE